MARSALLHRPLRLGPAESASKSERPAIGTAAVESGLALRARKPATLAGAVRAAWATGSNGVVVAVPPPAELEDAEGLVQRAVRELADVSGSDLTPRLLARVAELSSGKSLELNVDLVVNNARVAARVASAFWR